MASLLGLVLDTDFDDPTLPVQRSYDDDIGQAAGVLGWCVPDRDRVTLLNGRVTSVADRSPAGKAFSNAVIEKQPLWSATGGPAGKPCLVFDGARGDYLVPAAVLPVGADATWTKMLVVKAPAEPTANVYRDILSGDTATGSQRLAVRGVSQFNNRVNAATPVQAVGAYLPDTWTLIIASWSAVLSRAALSINGAPWVTATVAGAAVTDGSMNLGRTTTGGFPFTGSIADCLVLGGVDLYEAANAARLATAKQYARDRYELPVA